MLPRLPRNIRESLTLALQLGELEGGYQGRFPGDEAGVFVDYLWIATLPQCGRRGTLVIAAAHLTDVAGEFGIQRNIMYLQPMLDSGTVFKPPYPSIDVPLSQPDSVAHALLSMNMLPSAAAFDLDSDHQWYSVYTATMLSEGFFTYHGKPQTANMEHFWDALCERIKFLAGAYGDDDLIWCVKRIVEWAFPTR